MWIGKKSPKSNRAGIIAATTSDTEPGMMLEGPSRRSQEHRADMMTRNAGRHTSMMREEEREVAKGSPNFEADMTTEQKHRGTSNAESINYRKADQEKGRKQ